jgi:hypothetical protein
MLAAVLPCCYFSARTGAPFLGTDAYELTAEGAPLAEKRTVTFPNRKIVAGSSPVYEDASAICRLDQASLDALAGALPMSAFGERGWL